MIGLALFTSSCLASLCKKPIDVFLALKSFAVSAWLSALLFALKFWSSSSALLILALVLTTAAILCLKSNTLKECILLLALGALVSVVHFTPASSRYYWVNIKWNTHAEADYFSWDKYAWSLYQNQEYEAASEASHRALEMAEQHAVAYNESEYIQLITEHGEMIRSKSWESFR